jgi:hypothetical protein
MACSKVLFGKNMRSSCCALLAATGYVSALGGDPHSAHAEGSPADAPDLPQAFYGDSSL